MFDFEPLITDDNQLQKLFVQLNSEDFELGLIELLNIQEVLLRLSSIGKLPSTDESLRNVLMPLLCKSKDEQITFKKIFSSWFLENTDQQITKTSISQPSEYEKKINKASKYSSISWKVIVALISLVVGIVTLTINLPFFPNRQLSENPVDNPNVPINGQPIQDLISFDYQLFSYVALITILVIASVRFISLKLFTRRFINRLRTADGFDSRDHSFPIEDLSIFSHTMISDTARFFRKRRIIESQQIDIDATIESTAYNAGYIHQRLLQYSSTTEYVILIDEANHRDHLSNYLDNFFDELRDHDINFSRLYFDKDPRSCFKKEGKTYPLNLHTIFKKYPRDYLIIFTDGMHFIDSFDRIKPWVRQFFNWESVTIVSPRELELWGENEKLLLEFGFNLIPSFDAASLTDLEQLLSKSYLSSILNENQSYLISDETPEKDIVDELVLTLKEVLGTSGFFWLCSCAVFPQLVYNLTIFLGLHLTLNSKVIYDFQKLNQIIRLPWFRQGYMPDWLRLELLSNLPSEYEKMVRNELYVLFQKFAIESDLKLKIQISKKSEYFLYRMGSFAFRYNSRLLMRNSLWGDEIFLSFMQNRLSIKVTEIEIDNNWTKHKASDRIKSLSSVRWEILSESLILWVMCVIPIGLLAWTTLFSNYPMLFLMVLIAPIFIIFRLVRERYYGEYSQSKLLEAGMGPIYWFCGLGFFATVKTLGLPAGPYLGLWAMYIIWLAGFIFSNFLIALEIFISQEKGGSDSFS